MPLEGLSTHFISKLAKLSAMFFLEKCVNLAPLTLPSLFYGVEFLNDFKGGPLERRLDLVQSPGVSFIIFLVRFRGGVVVKEASLVGGRLEQVLEKAFFLDGHRIVLKHLDDCEGEVYYIYLDLII